MTLKDLVINGLVKDNDKITLSKPLTGEACDMRKGNWFNDKIMEYMNAEIKSFTWAEDSGWSIALRQVGECL